MSNMLWQQTLFIIFIFSPQLTVWLVILLLSFLWKLTIPQLPYTHGWLSILSTHSTGKKKNFFCFLLGSNIRSGLHSSTITYLNCDLDQVTLSKFQFLHLLKGNSNSDCTGLR